MKLIWALALIAPVAACATVTRGTTQAFVVETDPSGAAVQTSSGMHCPSTPCTFPRVPRNSDFTVTITKEGYRTTTHTVTHQTAGAGAAGMAGNVIVGGLIGVAIDAGSGATQDLVPNPLRVTLEAEEPVAATVAAEAAPPAEAAAEATAPEAAPAAAEAAPDGGGPA
jgi:hypothetical protein